jgi:hypothetical protein
MHYSIQHEFARAHLDALSQEADNARLHALAREGNSRPRFSRLSGLFERLQRQRARRPAPAAS